MQVLVLVLPGKSGMAECCRRGFCLRWFRFSLS